MIKKYRKLPVVIEALQYTGDNYEEVCEYVGETTLSSDIYKRLWIQSLEGWVKVSVGSYIVKGIKGEFYPCRGDIFRELHEEVE